MRLFVGIGLPDSIRGRLLALQPPLASAIRLMSADDMHITLHFIGDADAGAIEQALATVVYPSFDVTLSGVGRFRMRNGKQILWAGVDTNDGMRELHASCARALEPTGFESEKREYRPHITLARIKPGVKRGLVEDFLKNQNQGEIGTLHVDRFSLYNSETSEDGARYTILRSYELT